jgi:hypothetical protein
VVGVAWLFSPSLEGASVTVAAVVLVVDDGEAEGFAASDEAEGFCESEAEGFASSVLSDALLFMVSELSLAVAPALPFVTGEAAWTSLV